MRYVIMANGQGSRWKMFQGIPKHLIEIDGETLLQRTTRLVREIDSDAEVIISSANSDCVADGATRYEPKRNELEVDRFVPELMCDDMVFLYGDTFYTEDVIRAIYDAPTRSLMFFGNEKSIVAIKVHDADAMRVNFDKVRKDYISGKIDACKGWQVYHSYIEGEHGVQVTKVHEVGPDFVIVEDETGDFNSPGDLISFHQAHRGHSGS